MTERWIMRLVTSRRDLKAPQTISYPPNSYFIFYMNDHLIIIILTIIIR